MPDMTPEEARQILGGIKPGDMAAARPIWDTYFETISNAGQPASSGPGSLDERAAANQTSTLGQLRQTPGMGVTPQYESGHTVSTGLGGNVGVNPNLYADEQTARSLADILGGEARLSPRGNEGPFPKDPWWQIMIDGTPHNAGILANMLGRQQTAYDQGLANYERNLRSNPSIIGEGLLEAPIDPAGRFRQEVLTGSLGRPGLAAQRYEAGVRSPGGGGTGGGGAGTGGGGTGGGDDGGGGGGGGGGGTFNPWYFPRRDEFNFWDRWGRQEP